MKKLAARVPVIFDRILNIVTYTATGLLALVWLAVCFGILTRFLQHPQDWVLEVTEYSLVAITFLCAAWLLREEGHIIIDVIIERQNPRHQALLKFLVSIVAAIACLLLALYGTRATVEAFNIKIRQYSALQPPKYPLLAMVPAGFLLLFIQFLRRSRGAFRSWKVLEHKGNG